MLENLHHLKWLKNGNRKKLHREGVKKFCIGGTTLINVIWGLSKVMQLPHYFYITPWKIMDHEHDFIFKYLNILTRKSFNTSVTSLFKIVPMRYVLTKSIIKKLTRKLWIEMCKILLGVMVILKVHDVYGRRKVRPALG